MKTIFTNLLMPFLFLLLIGTICHAQQGGLLDPGTGTTLEQAQTTLADNNPIVNFDPAAFDCDCETDFFTVDDVGIIQKWSIINGTVSGGSVVLTGGSRWGLGFCGSETSRTFYCGTYTSNRIQYYDTISNGWLYITTPFTQPLNNGGHKQHQYYMSGTKVLYYYNGYTFSNVPVPNPFPISILDIAVDTFGQAWVFTGPSWGNSTELHVIDSTGIRTTYSITDYTSGPYGAFFVDGVLHIAKGTSNEIVPIIISGTSAYHGTPIPFQNNQYTDVASCQPLDPPEPPPCPDLTPVAYLLPNTITGMSPIEFAVKVTEVNNASTDGTPITVRIPSDSRLLFVWNIGLTQAAFIPVQNADWNYLGDNGLLHTWTYNGPGLVIPGGTSSAFGFQAFYDPQSTAGYTSISATIVPFSGGECNLTNNVDAEKLVYFD